MEEIIDIVWVHPDAAVRGEVVDARGRRRAVEADAAETEPDPVFAEGVVRAWRHGLYHRLAGGPQFLLDRQRNIPRWIRFHRHDRERTDGCRRIGPADCYGIARAQGTFPVVKQHPLRQIDDEFVILGIGRIGILGTTISGVVLFIMPGLEHYIDNDWYSDLSLKVDPAVAGDAPAGGDWLLSGAAQSCRRNCDGQGMNSDRLSRSGNEAVHTASWEVEPHTRDGPAQLR